MIITADKIDQHILEKIIIFDLDKNYNLIQKIYSESVIYKNNNWILKEVSIMKLIKDS